MCTHTHTRRYTFASSVVIQYLDYTFASSVVIQYLDYLPLWLLLCFFFFFNFIVGFENGITLSLQMKVILTIKLMYLYMVKETYSKIFDYDFFLHFYSMIRVCILYS